MKPLTFLQYSWVAQASVLLVATIVIVFAVPTRLAGWGQVLPILAGIIAGEGAAGFGGPALKRAQETRAATAEAGEDK